MSRAAQARTVEPDLREVHAEGEAMEMSALASLHAAATPGLRAALGLSWAENAEATDSTASALPASAIVVNRAVAHVAAAVPRLAEHYRASGVGRFFLHLPAGVAVPPALLRGLALTGARPWQKFLRLRGAPLPDAPTLDIERVRPGPAAEAAARIVCAAFDLGFSAEPWVARLCRDDRWQVFLARICGEPAGTGALFADAGIGWTDWGATIPASGAAVCSGRFSPTVCAWRIGWGLRAFTPAPDRPRPETRSIPTAISCAAGSWRRCSGGTSPPPPEAAPAD